MTTTGDDEVVSIRFSDARRHERLKDAAAKCRSTPSHLAERLIEEGLRMRDHPMVFFRDDQGRRQARLDGGPEVNHVVGAIVGSEIPIAERNHHAANLMAIPLRLVEAAMAYYAEFTDEVDGEIATLSRFAEQMEATWRHEQTQVRS